MAVRAPATKVPNMASFEVPKGPSEDKFRELVLFIAQKSEGDVQFGATKLNKLLFYADFLAYQAFGRAITSHRYQRLDKGPAPRALVPILARMESDGEIARVERQHYGKTQKRVIALREANLDLLSSKEVDLVSQLIREFWGKSAKAMSDLSHRFRGWKLAKDGEDIPYEVALVQFKKPTKADAAHWQKLAPDLAKIAKEFLAGDAS